MTPNPSETFSPSPASSGRRKLLVLGVLAVVLGLLMWFGRAWLTPSAVPPEVNLTGIDPEAATAVEKATAEVRSKPRDATAWSNLALTLFAHDFYVECLPCFAEAERLAPDDVRWPYFQGLALLSTNPPAALPHLERAAALAGRDAVPHVRFGEALLEQGQIAAAGEQFQKALQLDAGHPRALLGRGTALLKQGDAKGSLPYLRAVADHVTTRKTAQTMLADAFQKLDEKEHAAEARQLAATFSEDERWFDPFVEQAKTFQRGALPRLRTAQVLLEQKRLSEAVELLKETLRLFPNSDQAYLGLGKAYLLAGRFTEAEESLREALLLKPGAFQSVDLLGRSLFGQKRYQEAEEQFREALRLKPGDALCEYSLGQCRLQQGDKAGAIAAWQAALRSQSIAQIHYELGDLLAQEKRPQEALGHLEDAVRLEPEKEQYKKRRDEVKAKK